MGCSGRPRTLRLPAPGGPQPAPPGPSPDRSVTAPAGRPQQLPEARPLPPPAPYRSPWSREGPRRPGRRRSTPCSAPRGGPGRARCGAGPAAPGPALPQASRSARPALTCPASPARQRRALLATSEAAGSAPISAAWPPGCSGPGAAAMTPGRAAGRRRAPRRRSAMTNPLGWPCPLAPPPRPEGPARQPIGGAAGAAGAGSRWRAGEATAAGSAGGGAGLPPRRLSLPALPCPGLACPARLGAALPLRAGAAARGGFSAAAAGPGLGRQPQAWLSVAGLCPSSSGPLRFPRCGVRRTLSCSTCLCSLASSPVSQA